MQSQFTPTTKFDKSQVSSWASILLYVISEIFDQVFARILEIIPERKTHFSIHQCWNDDNP